MFFFLLGSSNVARLLLIGVSCIALFFALVMNIRKEELKVKLDSELMLLLQKFSSTNKVSVQQGLEMITRIFLTDNNVTDMIVVNHHLDTAVEELKEELEGLKNSNYVSVCSIEKLREQICCIEQRFDDFIAEA